VAALAAKYAERITAGETLETLAKEAGAKIETTKPVTRSTSPQGLTQNAVQQAFTLPKGGATSALTTDGKARTILRVVDVIPAPPATPEQTERLKTELTRQMQTDILAEYIGGLQARYGVSINEPALKQIIGTEREAPETD
jgi:peptidyl-prolyl cis-trans isomerase D